MTATQQQTNFNLWEQLKKIWVFDTMTTGKSQKGKSIVPCTRHASLDDLKAMIQMNLIKNNSVTTEDVNLTARAFVLDVATLKGKTTRKTQHQQSVFWRKYRQIIGNSSRCYHLNGRIDS